MLRPAQRDFRYQLVAEDGASIGDVASEQSSWAVGDLLPCGKHIFDICGVHGSTLHVRKVL